MLKKRHYYLTLGIGVLAFFIVFVITYYFVKMTTTPPQQVPQMIMTRNEKSIDAIAYNQPKPEVTIQPNTHITLSLVDQDDTMLDSKELDPLSLLGVNQTTLKQKFAGYQVDTFNEQNVLMKKVLTNANQSLDYVLGIQDDYVCIVEEGPSKQYIKLNIPATQFSTQTYSLLLKEQIKITTVQKDKLLLDSTYIETILQSYQEE